MKKVWIAGEVLVDLIPDSTGIRLPIVGGGGANTAKASALLGLERSEEHTSELQSH